MRFTKFIYGFLIVLSGLLYSLTGSALLFILTGVCLSALMVSGNTIAAAVASVITLGYCFLFNSTADVAIMLFLCGIVPGILLSVAYKKALPLSYLVAVPTCCYISGRAYMFFSYKSENGTNMFEDAISLISTNFHKSLSAIVQQTGEQLDEEVIALLSQAMDFSFKTLLQLVPCLIILYSCMMALVLVWLSKKTAMGFGCAPVRSFSKIYAPRAISWLIFLCLIGSFVAKESMSFFFINLLVLFLAYYMLCGLSLLDFFFQKVLHIPWLRAFIYAAALLVLSLILPQLALGLLVLAGMADIIFDFRKLRPPLPDFPENE